MAKIKEAPNSPPDGAIVEVTRAENPFASSRNLGLQSPTALTRSYSKRAKFMSPEQINKAISTRKLRDNSSMEWHQLHGDDSQPSTKITLEQIMSNIDFDQSG